MKLINSESEFASAWIEGVRHLASCGSHDEYNLILYIPQPLKMSDESKFILTEYDSLLRSKGNSLATVAGTIFPAKMYLKNKKNWAGMRAEYLAEYPWIKNHRSNGWGTYAHRLLFRKLNNAAGEGEEIDPLGCIIDKINKCVNEQDKNIKSAYEIDLMDETLDASIYRGLTDRKRRLGGPCMSHLSFKVDGEKKLHLTVLYRSHYYLERTLGNLLGLSQLHRALCEQTKLEPGPMTCVSTYALLDTGKDKSGLLLKDVTDFITKIDDYKKAKSE